jgi:hypothetical protein
LGGALYSKMGIGNYCGLGSTHSQHFRRYLCIPTSELHSPFDHEYMWQYAKTMMYEPIKKCGCYTTETEDEHEHYTNTTTTCHLCPEHYSIYLAEEKRILQCDMEKKIHRDTCTENVLALAKEKQQEMTNIITNLTVPFLKDLNDALPDNMFYRICRCTHNCRCITGYFKNTAMNDHTCTCKYNISFHAIKCKKIAKKTYKFDMPEPNKYNGSIGTITIYHCKCHCDNWLSGDTFKIP